MKNIIFLLVFMTCGLVQAETFRIATGEYIPYTGENIPNQGISSMVVRAVFKEIKQDIIFEFMPWNRVMLLTKNGSVAGSFPWNKNTDRIKDSYYSMPINQYRYVAFYKKGNEYNKESSLYKKIICLPSGWDISIFQSLINKMKMEVVSPTTIESCFKMIAKSRVDIVFIDELVGKNVEGKVFGKLSPLVSSEQVYLKKVVNLHFIVSRKYSNGKAILERFNHGLERIKANGIYDSIISAKSTCEICNQLGSM